MPIDFTSADSIIQSYLDGYGLGSLSAWALQMVTDNPNLDEATFKAMLYETPEFKAAYPAFDRLRQEGRGISVEDYRQYTMTVREQLDRWGIPQEMYGTTEKIGDLLINNVTAPEIGERIQRAAEGVFSAPSETLDALRNLYGVDSGGLIAYWLDPEAAQPILERQWAASKIAGAAARQSAQMQKEQAERLLALGITEQQTEQAYGAANDLRGLTGGDGETVTRDDIANAALGVDNDAAQRVRRVQSGRTARFSEGGGAAEGQGGISGLGR